MSDGTSIGSYGPASTSINGLNENKTANLNTLRVDLSKEVKK